MHENANGNRRVDCAGQCNVSGPGVRRWFRERQAPLTVSTVLFDGGGRELDGAVAGVVLRESQILQVHLCV